ncbi:TPA: hypothetical protein R7I52_003962 [Klebsiella pneumoniae]|nr:hypothetical protein [Klebsiella pneumoniae]
MGWLFSHRSRSELIHYLVQPQDCQAAFVETVAYTLRGNVLWSVVKITAKEPNMLNLAAGDFHTYIGCTLLQRYRNEWGYKSMDESVHPYYYSCPLSYLERAPTQSAEWRERVRAYHDHRRAVRSASAVPVV